MTDGEVSSTFLDGVALSVTHVIDDESAIVTGSLAVGSVSERELVAVLRQLMNDPALLLRIMRGSRLRGCERMT